MEVQGPQREVGLACAMRGAKAFSRRDESRGAACHDGPEGLQGKGICRRGQVLQQAAGVQRQYVLGVEESKDESFVFERHWARRARFLKVCRHEFLTGWSVRHAKSVGTEKFVMGQNRGVLLQA